MSRKLDSSPAVIGIDIGKNSFHIRWPEPARCHRAAAEMVAWPGGGPTRRCAAVSDRGGLRGRRLPYLAWCSLPFQEPFQAGIDGISRATSYRNRAPRAGAA